MKKLALVIMFSLLATSAFAQNWGSNNIGVYLDATAESHCGYGTGQIACYLIGTGLETATVGGFELKLTVTGPAFGPLNQIYPPDAINLANRPSEYVVGFGTPVPAGSGLVTFMTFDLLVTNDLTATELFIEPIYFPSIAGSGAYLDGADYNIILPLFNATGDPLTGATVPVMTVNGDCVVPAEDASWGGVKSLFR